MGCSDTECMRSGAEVFRGHLERENSCLLGWGSVCVCFSVFYVVRAFPFSRGLQFHGLFAWCGVAPSICKAVAAQLGDSELAILHTVAMLDPMELDATHLKIERTPVVKATGSVC